MTPTQRTILRHLAPGRPKTAMEVARVVAGLNAGAAGRSLRTLMQQGAVEQVRMGTDRRAGYGYRLILPERGRR